MEVLSVYTAYDPSLDQKWSRMFILALVLHLAVFSTILFVPEPMTSRRIRDVVYEVNLVDMPAGRHPTVGSSAQTKTEKGLTVPAPAIPAKRIDRPKQLEKPLVMAKKTVDIKPEKIRPPEDSSTKLLDQALAKIEKKANEEKREEKGESADQAISEMGTAAEKTATRGTATGQTAGTGSTGRLGAEGISEALYRTEITNLIYRNWSYPTALLDNRKDLSAVVEIKVARNGTILRTILSQRSGNEKFDQSVLNAIKRSDPLPPKPESLPETDNEIVITFNLSDLINQ